MIGSEREQPEEGGGQGPLPPEPVPGDQTTAHEILAGDSEFTRGPALQPVPEGLPGRRAAGGRRRRLQEIPDWARDQPGRPRPPRVGGYRLGPLLGEGGMGAVYLAWDPSLGRRVALKLVRGESPELVQRMFQEAQLQARVEHPAVCRIYQIGEDAKRPYIAMQFIQGANLADWRHHLGIEQRVRLLIQVADAVHAAHRVGLIHRDLKPSNLLVEQDEAGVLRPFVMDFGLARDLEGGGITQQGIAVGSPSYMAPEQASGGRVDERTDVYGLGATLYEVLCGAPPFRGASAVETVRRVMEWDAPRLGQRAPGIPPDLESVVHRCLEKDPGLRYPSARELRDDLQRFLDGEPVEARRQNTLRRLWARAKRNRALSLVVGGATLLVLLLGIFALWTWRRGLERTLWAQRFGQQVREMDGTLRNAHLFPLHDLRPEKSEVRSRLDRIRELVKRGGPAGVGPGNLALGQGLLMLGEPEAARGALAAAWESGYRTPEVALAMLEALAELARRGAEQAFLIPHPGLREATLAHDRRVYRGQAQAFLARARLAGEWTPSQESAVARLTGQVEVAERVAREGFDRQRWNYEVRLEEVEAIFQHVRELPEDQDARLAARLGEAERLLAWLRETARSDPRVHLAEAQSRLLRIRLDAPGRGLEPSLREGLQALDRASQSDPGSGLPHLFRAQLYFWTGLRQVRNPFQGSYWMDRALESCALALADPAFRASALAYRGSLAFHKARTLLEGGRDPGPALQEGREAWQKALAESRGPEGLAFLGSLELAFAYLVVADFESAHGRNPGPSLSAARETFVALLASDPGNEEATLQLAAVHRRLGEDAASRGAPTDPHLRASRENLENHLRKVPGAARAWLDLGQVALLQAEVAQGHGESEAAFLAKAEEAFGKALALQPRQAAPRYGLVAAEWLRSRGQAAGGDPVVAPLAQGFRTLGDIRQVEGGAEASWEVQVLESKLRLEEARRWRASAQDRAATQTLAVEAARRATRQAPRQAEAWKALGMALLAQEWTRFEGSAAPRLPEVRRAFQRAEAINPADPETLLGLSRSALLEAAGAVRAGRRAGLGPAEAPLARLLQRNPRQAEALALRASICLFGGPPGGSPETLARCREMARAALAVHPGQPVARRLLGLQPRGPGPRDPDPGLEFLLDRWEGTRR
ncbi:MAG: protein kinase [Acidobacteria bacterium]|nr:protein kinase [Acidobacteriota bacterium]